jgi:hypothetical protein
MEFVVAAAATATITISSSSSLLSFKNLYRYLNHLDKEIVNN